MDFDFLSSNLQIAYPFLWDVTVARPSGNVSLVDLMAALRLYTSDSREAELYIDEIDLRSNDNFVTLSTAMVELRWSDGITMTLEDGVTATAQVVKYGLWVVVTWRRTETGQLPTVLQIVFPLAAVAAGSPETYRFWKLSEDVEVLSALVKQGPEKVCRVFVKRGSELVQVTGPGEQVVVQPGFNMQVVAGDLVLSGGRRLTTVAVDAVPGAGKGRYLRCLGNAYLLTLTGVPPDSIGNAKLNPQECYWLERALSQAPTPLAATSHGFTQAGALLANELQLHNACGPCCSCADYVAAYERLRTIWDRAKVTSAKFYELRTKYNELIAQYEAITAQLHDLLTLTQYRDDSIVVLIALTNDTAVPIVDDVVVDITITTPDGVTYSYYDGSGFMKSSRESGSQDPSDPDGSPSLTFDSGISVGGTLYWTGIWRLLAVAAADEITVTLLVSGGMTNAASELLTIE